MDCFIGDDIVRTFGPKFHCYEVKLVECGASETGDCKGFWELDPREIIKFFHSYRSMCDHSAVSRTTNPY